MLPHGFITLMHPWKLGGARLPSFAASVLHHAGVIQPKAFWHDQLDCHQTGLKHTNETYIWLASQWTGMETGFYAKQAFKRVTLSWVERKHPVPYPTRRKEDKVSANLWPFVMYIAISLGDFLQGPSTSHKLIVDAWWSILNLGKTTYINLPLVALVSSQRALPRLDFGKSHSTHRNNTTSQLDSLPSVNGGENHLKV